MRGWFGVGQESAGGVPTAPAKTYRVIPMGSDVCTVCDEIRTFEELEYIGTDAWENPLYRCKEHTTGTPNEEGSGDAA